MTNVGISLNAEVIELSGRAPQEPQYAMKLNCRREGLRAESSFGLIALLLTTDDPNRVVFHRAGLRRWIDLSSWVCKSLGRKDIFISNRPPQQTEATAQNSLVRFEYPANCHINETRRTNHFGHSLKGYCDPDNNRGIIYKQLHVQEFHNVDIFEEIYLIIIKLGRVFLSSGYGRRVGARICWN